MSNVIILCMLLGLNVIASLFNCVLCVYFISIKQRYSVDGLLFTVSVILSVFVLVCDVIYSLVHTLHA